MNERIRAGQASTHSSRSPFGKWIIAIVLLVLLAAIATGAWWIWQRKDAAPPPQTSPLETSSSSIESATPNAPSEAANGPATDSAATTTPSFLDATPQAPENAIEPPQESAPNIPAPAQTAADAQQVLMQWLGRENTYAFIQSNGFINRFVATVDNLPRAKAPTQSWPLNPTAPRFEVQAQAFGGDAIIAPANAARYARIVNFAKSLDMAQAATIYKQNYPLFQAAYEELGYPNQYFNDRLVEVIDHLLQAPELATVQVRLQEIKGDYPSLQPWVHYEFADPQLEALSAGQKIMVRLGLENERAVKSQLREFRAHIAAQQAPTPTTAQ